jgi:D-alanine-D-alanine ligase
VKGRGVPGAWAGPGQGGGFTEKLNVGVIFGGRSGEHAVSLRSACSIIAALDPDRYEVVPIGITQEGQWVRTRLPSPGSGLEAVGQSVLVLPAPGHPPCLLDQSEPLFLDVVFPVVHGTFGEDGTLQGLLELAGIPYVGPGVLASAVGMDKEVMKRLFVQAGLPVLPFLKVMRYQWEQSPQTVIARVESEIGYPCFTKPANLGSSVGVSRVTHRRALERGLMDAARYDRKVLVEVEAPDCREVECSVLGNDYPEASVVGEIIPSREFYDYAAKYLDGTSQLIIPAALPAPTTRQVRELAIKAFLAIDACGMARVDFFVGRKDHRVWLNEINTIPGFTSISMYPKLWEASGLPYPELLDRLIRLALERHADSSRRLTQYQPLPED